MYAALAELAGRYARHPDATPSPGSDLTRYELRVFSQNGEDGVIEEILRRIGVSTRSFVEFGVESGAEGNCVFLAEVLGWEGLFMEGDEAFFKRLSRRYRGNPRVRVLQAMVGPSTINSLLGSDSAPAEPDVLSIDVDGIDYWIWRALEVVRPRLVVIEYNAHLEPGQSLVQPLLPEITWDGSDYFGASLDALVGLAHEKGYRLVHADIAGVNAFFVRSDLAAPFGSEDDVARRAPNYLLRGEGHPPHTGGRTYVRPDS